MSIRHYFILALLAWVSASCSESYVVRDGFGKANLPDGSVYEGGFCAGLFNGNDLVIGINGRLES